MFCGGLEAVPLPLHRHLTKNSLQVHQYSARSCLLSIDVFFSAVDRSINLVESIFAHIRTDSLAGLHFFLQGEVANKVC